MADNKRLKATMFIHCKGDWCHICGERHQDVNSLDIGASRKTLEFVNVSYPENAEHDESQTRYIRICEHCVDRMKEVLTKGE
jgi:hypothetical protein